MIALGIDAWNLPGDRRGIGRYLREIMRVWWRDHHNRVEVTLIVPQWHTWTVRRIYRREVDGHAYRVTSRRGHARAKLDALWFPFNGCSWTDFDLPATATLHDASNFVVPNYAPQTTAIFRAAAQRCRGLITDSLFAQRELARELGIAAQRIVPIPLAARPPLAPRPVALDVAGLRRFVLYVGTPEWRKGFDTLVAAMALLGARGLRLVVTGNLGGRFAIPQSVKIVELGWVDDATLAALYRACSVMAFPSRYEGFGLPVIEAMSYGAPVVAANAASLPEVAADAAAYVSPGEPNALADAIARICDDALFADGLRRRGLARAAGFTWEATASQTLAVIKATLA